MGEEKQHTHTRTHLQHIPRRPHRVRDYEIPRHANNPLAHMHPRAVDRVNVADEIANRDAAPARVELGDDDKVAERVDGWQHGCAGRGADAVEVLPEEVQEAEALEGADGVVELLGEDTGCAGWRCGGGSSSGEPSEEEGEGEGEGRPHFGLGGGSEEGGVAVYWNWN